MCTTRSGRNARLAAASCSCSVKSQCSESPASSTRRRSVSSPQRPRTSGRRSAVDQIARLALQLRLATGERLDLGAQARERLAPLALECLHLRLGALERRAQRLHQRRDRHLALLERALRDHLVAPERLARHAQEHLAVAAQRFPGEGVEGGAQALLGLLEHRHALGVLQRLGLQARAARRRARPAVASTRRVARMCASSAPSTAPATMAPKR